MAPCFSLSLFLFLCLSGHPPDHLEKPSLSYSQPWPFSPGRRDPPQPGERRSSRHQQQRQPSSMQQHQQRHSSPRRPSSSALCSKIRSVTSLSLIRKRLRASSDPAKQRLRDEAKRVHVSLASKKRKTSENLSSQTRPLHRKKTIEARSHRLENFPITACDTPPRRLGLEALTLLALLLLRQQQQQSLLRAPLPRDLRSNLPSKRKRERERRSRIAIKGRQSHINSSSLTFGSRRSVFPSPARLIPRDTNDTMATATAIEATQKVRAIARESRIEESRDRNQTVAPIFFFDLNLDEGKEAQGGEPETPRAVPF